MDPQLAKWLRWMPIIRSELRNLMVSKDVFWDTQRIIRRNKQLQKPSAFYRFLGEAYGSHIISGIRRQMKSDEQSISFGRLLEEMAANPKAVPRLWYKKLYEGSVVVDLADADFDRFAGKGKGHVSSTMVLRDLARLKKVGANCEEFADRRVAHRDKRDVSSPPTFREADRCVDLLDRLYCKYRLLLFAEHIDTLLPTYQYDWKVIFEVPWLRKRNAKDRTDEPRASRLA